MAQTAARLPLEELVTGLSRVGGLEPVVKSLLSVRLCRSRFGPLPAIRTPLRFCWCEEIHIAGDLVLRNAAAIRRWIRTTIRTLSSHVRRVRRRRVRLVSRGTHMIHHIFLHARVLPAVAAAGMLVPVVAGAAPASAATAPQVSCTSGKVGLAAKLQRDIAAALATRTGTVAVGLRDRTTNTTCTLRATSSYDSASVVKVTVLATLLWDAKKTNRYLTSRETNLATAMITKSDNAATTSLWNQLGVTKVKGFLAAAGMTRTVPGSGGYWGLTQINVTDEQRLLSLITARNTVLSDNSRAYILKLMGNVVTSQRWGRRPARPPPCPSTSRTAGCSAPRAAGACTASARSRAAATTTPSPCSPMATAR